VAMATTFPRHLRPSLKTPRNARMVVPGELSAQLALADDFLRYHQPPWPWLQEHSSYVMALIAVFLGAFFRDTSATRYQKAQRRRDLIKSMEFNGPGSCEMRREIEGWSVAPNIPKGVDKEFPKYFYAWMREATATRYPFGPIAVKTHFAGYLRDDLRQKGVLLPRRETGACVICGKVYRCELPGTVRMRLAVPCGHWCCDEPCAKQLEQHANAAKRQLDCAECRRPLKQYKVSEYPGQCVEVEDDAS